MLGKVLLVAGAREFNCYLSFKSVMTAVEREIGIPTKIISGGATGVDTMAKTYALEKSIAFEEYPADWKQYGKKAGPLRNSKMIKLADVVVALPSPNSIGTYDTIRKAERAKKQLFVFNVLTPVKLSDVWN